MTGAFGTVYLIGAGPGDPGLITVRGRECLERAAVVIYDYLANPALLDALAPEVERIYVGKRHGDHLRSQEEINALLVEHARAGRTVARLKGGDPFIFGRGGEEALALAEAGIPFEVVPGVTAATAVAAYAGIPLTHRGVNASVTFVTGSEDAHRKETLIRWDELGRATGTLVFFMGVKRLPEIAERLIAGGRRPDTPAAAIRWGTHPCQHTVTAPLKELARRVQEAELTPPALIVVGDVVALRERINWFERRPLFGQRVLVTRAAGQQRGLAQALHEQGADVVPVPTLSILPPVDFAPLDEAIAGLSRFHWLVLTSANGVAAFFERLHHHGRDTRALAGVRVAVVGAETARALAGHGLAADLVPADSRAEGVADALLAEGVRGQRVLLAQAEKARRVLPRMLAEGGAEVTAVTAYRTACPQSGEVNLAPLERGPAPDYVTFTSSSTVTNLQTLLGEARFAELLGGARVAAIGPITAATVRSAGLAVHLEPKIPSVAALVDAICADAGARRAARRIEHEGANP